MKMRSLPASLLRDRRNLPLMSALCVFFIALLCWFSWKISPEKQAEAALRDLFTVSSIEEFTEEPASLYPALFGEENAAVRAELLRMDLRKSAEGEFSFNADYRLVLDRGNEPTAPVEDRTCSGMIAMKKARLFTWAPEEIVLQ